MMAAQLFLLELCVRLNARHDGAMSSIRRNLNPLLALQNTKARTDLRDRRRFWQWADMHSYVLALGAMNAGLAALHLLVGSWSVYVEAVGVAALLLESMLAMPQAFQNWRRKSTQGLRYIGTL
jgi:hypothetical protein